MVTRIDAHRQVDNMVASDVRYEFAPIGCLASPIDTVQEAIDALCNSVASVTPISIADGDISDIGSSYAAGSIGYDDTIIQCGETTVQGALECLAGSIAANISLGWKATYKHSGAAIGAGTPILIPDSRTYAIASDYLDVFLNGQLLTINSSFGAGDEDYDEESAGPGVGSVVSFENNITNKDRITFVYHPDRV